MSIFSDSIPSFLLGILAGAALVVFSGFGSAAGKDLWIAVKRSFDRSTPDPLEVGIIFSPKAYKPQHCGWITEFNVQNKESQGWRYYPHPISKGKCYRLTRDNDIAVKEYLMITPNAEKTEPS